MSIAKRLTILIAVPLAILVCLGGFLSFQFERIAEQSRYIAVVQAGSLEAIADITRSFSEMRVNLRSIMLSKDRKIRDENRALLKQNQRELHDLFKQYEASFILDAHDREMFKSFQETAAEWEEGAAEIMLFVGADDVAGALRLLNTGAMHEVGPRASRALDGWNDYHNQASQVLAAAALQEMSSVRWQTGLGVGFAVLITCWMGLLTYRGIVIPIRTLNGTVKRVAEGDYSVDVPYVNRVR